MSDVKKPILIKGEAYINPHPLPKGFPQGDKRPDFEEMKHHMIDDLGFALKKIEMTPSMYIMDDVVVNMRMDVDYSAKSYHPEALIKAINATDIGSRKWTKVVQESGKKKTKIGKEVFMRIDRKDIKRFETILRNNTELPKGVVENIRSYDSLYVCSNETLINKFEPSWEEGRVEIVLHPFGSSTEETRKRLLALIAENQGDISKVKMKTYESGITFVSAVLKRNVLEGIIKFNPIRTAHPLLVSSSPFMRLSDSGLPLPLSPSTRERSSIKVGVFDGGIDSTCEHFRDFTVEHNPVGTPKDDEFVSHGMGVTGAVLYGNISHLSSKDRLPTPKVNVESFRVFPPSDDYDYDLYEAIDIIESVVSARKDIQVYNLSIGPHGAIDDDDISRFTYAIDELSKNGDKLFIVAVGNDGDLDNEALCRIQAPSDAVNCIGVGACVTERNGDVTRADYSSYGDGREGCKVKPDVVAFGGDERDPFHLISLSESSRFFSCGTSFAAPIVASRAAEIIGRCNVADPLLARAILIHTAKHPSGDSDKFLGHGCVCDSVDEMLYCEDGKVTVIYQNKISPRSMVKIPLPFLNDLEFEGKVKINWTIALATSVDAKHSEDYTLSCVEDTFYPNSFKYEFSKGPVGKKATKLIDARVETEQISALLEDGWKSANNPKSYSNFDNRYKPEQDRKSNFKWDTIVNRKTSMKYSSLYDPYITLHAMDRNGSDADFVNYAVIATIEYLKATGNMYEGTREKFKLLEVAEIRNEVELLIR